MYGSRRGGVKTGCAVLALLVLAVLIGGGWYLVNTGLDLVAEQVGRDIADNPVVLEHIGTIEDIELDLGASGELPGENDFAFKLRGSKGSGQLTATTITVDENTERVTAGVLRMSSGETYDLFPAEAPEEAPGSDG